MKNINEYNEIEINNTRLNSWKVADNLNKSFNYAFKGIKYAFNTQRNFKIQVFTAAFATSYALIFRIDVIKIAIIIIAITIVLSLELINTSLESAVNLSIGKEFHPLAKIAKDCAAGAVLIASISSIFLALIVLLSP